MEKQHQGNENLKSREVRIVLTFLGQKIYDRRVMSFFRLFMEGESWPIHYLAEDDLKGLWPTELGSRRTQLYAHLKLFSFHALPVAIFSQKYQQCRCKVVTRAELVKVANQFGVNLSKTKLCTHSVTINVVYSRWRIVALTPINHSCQSACGYFVTCGLEWIIWCLFFSGINRV